MDQCEEAFGGAVNFWRLYESERNKKDHSRTEEDDDRKKLNILTPVLSHLSCAIS